MASNSRPKPVARRRSGTAGRATGQRNREETRERILAAMGRLLARKGSRSLGVNAIAREARVDKVLIYRYFGGLPQLYQAFAREGDTFPSLEEIADGKLAQLSQLQPGEAVKAAMLGFVRAVRRRPITMEMMRWELQERNELTDALGAERNRLAESWFALAPDVGDADLAAVISVLVAGQIFLTLRSKTADTYNGIELRSENGWRRIERAAALLSDLFFERAAAKL